MRTWTETLNALARAKIKIGTFVDCGAATGHLSTDLALRGLFPGAAFFNIDANANYEPVYKRIAATIGGGYTIAALDASPSVANLNLAQDPDWASLRPTDDPYWSRLPGAAAYTKEIRTRTLDEIVATHALAPPFGLKLDVQGFEPQALRGGVETLRRTEFLIVETDVSDFGAIHVAATEAGLELFDLSSLGHSPDERLLEFYCTYLRSASLGAFAGSWVPAERQAWLAGVVARRRQKLLELVNANLAALEARKAKL